MLISRRILAQFFFSDRLMKERESRQSHAGQQLLIHTGLESHSGKSRKSVSEGDTLRGGRKKCKF